MRSQIGILILFALLLLTPARSDGPGSSHRHPQGGDWIQKGQKVNPMTREWCCGEGDCFEVPKDHVTMNGKGYVLFGAELVPFQEAQPSIDGAFWRCKRPDGTRRCFFAPPPGA